MIAMEQPTIMMGPRALIRSDVQHPNRTVKNATMFGGTVKSWAVTRV